MRKQWKRGCGSLEWRLTLILAILLGTVGAGLTCGALALTAIDCGGFGGTACAGGLAAGRVGSALPVLDVVAK